MTETAINANKELYKGQASIFTLVIGKSGRGKSSSMRNLNPDSTYLINVLGKPLPFLAGARYRAGENMTSTADAAQIMSTMNTVSRNEKWSTLVIDDIQYVMASEFMSKVMIKGYDKFSIMARNIWDIMLLAGRLRSGLKVYILAHEQDEGGERKMKTLGKLLDEKITPEGMTTIVLYADVVEGDTRQHFFSTQSDGVTNAKSPMGMFPPYIPNDLALVNARIDEYYSGIPLEQSKLHFDNVEVKRERR